MGVNILEGLKMQNKQLLPFSIIATKQEYKLFF